MVLEKFVFFFKVSGKISTQRTEKTVRINVSELLTKWKYSPNNNTRDQTKQSRSVEASVLELLILRVTWTQLLCTLNE